MEGLNAEDFEGRLGQMLRVPATGHALRLAEVQRGAQPLAFTLILEGPPGEVLPENLREFQLEDGGRAAFHIMPIHTTAPGRQDYPAVFN